MNLYISVFDQVGPASRHLDIAAQAEAVPLATVAL
jgi:hypothetical protein